MIKEKTYNNYVHNVFGTITHEGSTDVASFLKNLREDIRLSAALIAAKQGYKGNVLLYLSFSLSIIFT